MSNQTHIGGKLSKNSQIFSQGRLYCIHLLVSLIVIYLTCQSLDENLKQYIYGFLLDYGATFIRLKRRFPYLFEPTIAHPYVAAFKPTLVALLAQSEQDFQVGMYYEQTVGLFKFLLSESSCKAQVPNLVLEAIEMFVVVRCALKPF